MAGALQETELKVGDRVFMVRPTFRAIAAIEGALDKSSLVIGARITRMEATLHEQAVAVFHLTRGQPDAPKSVEEAGEMLLEHGVRGHQTALSDVLLRAWAGNAEHRKEAAAGAETDPPQASVPVA